MKELGKVLGVGWGFPLLNGHYHSIRDQVWSQFARTKAQRGQAWGDSSPFKVDFPSPYTGIFPQRKGVLKWVLPLNRQRFEALSVQASMALFRHGLKDSEISPLFLTADHYSLLLPLHSVVEPLSRAGRSPHDFLVYIEMLAVMGSWPSRDLVGFWDTTWELQQWLTPPHTWDPTTEPDHLCIIGKSFP